MRAGLGLSVGGVGQLWVRVGKSGQVWMSRTDWAGMDDMVSGLVWVCVQV